MWDRIWEWRVLIPVWTHAARGSAHWRTGTECSPLQPTVQPGRTAATPSSPSGWRGEERCQRGGGQSQRWQEHRAGRPGCQLKSWATCHTRYLQIIRNEGSEGINTRCTRWQFHTPCTFHIWFTASSNYFCRRLPDSDTWLWNYVLSYYWLN